MLFDLLFISDEVKNLMEVKGGGGSERGGLERGKEGGSGEGEREGWMEGEEGDEGGRSEF